MKSQFNYETRLVAIVKFLPKFMESVALVRVKIVTLSSMIVDFIDILLAFPHTKLQYIDEKV